MFPRQEHVTVCLDEDIILQSTGLMKLNNIMTNPNHKVNYQ